MRRERTTATSRHGRAKLLRTTVFLTEPLDFYLDLAALQQRRPKGELVREAVAKWLEGENGFKNVTEMPHGRVSIHLPALVREAATRKA